MAVDSSPAPRRPEFSVSAAFGRLLPRSTRLRRGAAVGLAVVVHLALFWMILGSNQGLEARSSAMSLSFVDPLGIPITLPAGQRASALPGGPEAAGDREAEVAPRRHAGDGSSADGEGGEATVETLTEDIERQIQAGDAAQSRNGVGMPFAGGPAGAGADNAYQRLLQRHIRPFRLYPAEAVPRRAEGVVIVRFRISRAGGVEEAWVVRRSPDPALDRAALETLWRAEPMPAVPSDLPAPVEVELPVPFRLPGR